MVHLLQSLLSKSWTSCACGLKKRQVRFKEISLLLSYMKDVWWQCDSRFLRCNWWVFIAIILCNKTGSLDCSIKFRVTITVFYLFCLTKSHALLKYFKGHMSDSFTNYNYVGNTKISVSIKKLMPTNAH